MDAAEFSLVPRTGTPGFEISPMRRIRIKCEKKTQSSPARLARNRVPLRTRCTSPQFPPLVRGCTGALRKKVSRQIRRINGHRIGNKIASNDTNCLSSVLLATTITWIIMNVTSAHDESSAES